MKEDIKDMKAEIEELRKLNKQFKKENKENKEKRIKEYQEELTILLDKESITKEELKNLITIKANLIPAEALKELGAKHQKEIDESVFDNLIADMIVETLKDNDIQELFSKVYDELEIDIEKLDSITPTSYIMANNKMMNKLSNGELKEGLTDLLVIDRPRKEVVTPISLNYDDENIQIVNKDKRFTPYDRTVHNSICSIFEAGNGTFTPDQVYRCMNGLNNTEKVSPQAIGAVTKSIDKTRRMYTKIEVEKEAKEYGLDKIKMEDHILSARKITLEAGGHEVVGYKFNYSNNSKPIIYEYAQMTRQVLTIPRELLNTKDVIRSTTEVTIIREYLIRRIEVMKRKGNKHQSNKIRFTSINQEIGQDDPAKEKAKKIRDNSSKLLDSFKDNDYIKEYKFYKEGRSFKGIEIFY